MCCNPMQCTNAHAKSDNSVMNDELNVSISFNQNVFKRKLTHVLTKEFVISVSMMKTAQVAQSKCYPRPCSNDGEDVFGLTYPIGWR